MSRATTVSIKVGVAVFLLVSGALGVATALSSEMPGSNLSAVLVVGESLTDLSESAATSDATVPVVTTTTTTAVTPTTDPAMVANGNALVEIPEVVLDTIGGRDVVEVTAFDRNGSSFEDWSGDDVETVDGRAEMGTGVYVAPRGVGAPIAIIGRVSYSESTEFEIVVETGDWNTDDFLRWGISANSDSITPNVWSGTSKIEFTAVPISPIVDDYFWIVLAIDRATAMLAVVPAGSDSAEGAVWNHEWAVEDWRLGIQVFSGSLSVDRYYILVP